jgi:hypothetical protein
MRIDLVREHIAVSARTRIGHMFKVLQLSTDKVTPAGLISRNYRMFWT